MTLANTSLVPEFQHFFYEYVLGSTVNKNQIPLPVDIDPIFLKDQSVVELLYKDLFPYNSYYYLYSEESIGSWPVLTRQRLMIYPSSKYLIPDSTGNNIFNLQSDDFTMLNVLLQYRHDSTSVMLFDTTADSTALIIITDATSNSITIIGDVDDLNTPLSKLIFLYLDLHINRNFMGYYNIPDILSDCSMLTTFFELILIDDYFDFMSDRGITFDLICDEPDEEIQN